MTRPVNILNGPAKASGERGTSDHKLRLSNAELAPGHGAVVSCRLSVIPQRSMCSHGDPTEVVRYLDRLWQ
jgi:hypothetical protein